MAGTLVVENVQAIGMSTIRLDTGADANSSIIGYPGNLEVQLGGPLEGLFTIIDTGLGIDDKLTITSVSTTSQDLVSGNAITSSGYETLEINTTVTGNAITQDYGAIIINPDKDGTATLNFRGTNVADIGGTITADIIDASGMTAITGGIITLDMTGNAPESRMSKLQIIGSPGDDIILGDTDEITHIVGGLE